VSARDAAGNVSTPVSYTWTVDLTPPSTSIQATQAQNQGPSITFSLSSSKPGSTFVCALDGATPTACGSTVSYSSLSPGAHSFYADATDAVGNSDPIGATYSFQVAPPLSTTITGMAPTNPLTNQTSMTLSFTSNGTGASFLCSLDGATKTSCSSPATYTGLANGNHTFSVYATSGGQTDTTGASYSWTVDTVPATITAITMSQTSTSFTINWTTSKPTTTGMDWGQGVSIGNVVPEDTAYVTSHTMTISNLNPNTTYTYLTTGHDQAGNSLTAGRRSIKTSP
jgi:hypothetical protein